MLRISREEARDAARLGLQTAVAAAATWLLMTAAGLPQVSWAVISALFVGQRSADGTLGAGLGRLGGVLLGTLAGLLSVHFAGGPEATPLRLLVVALLCNAFSSVYPSTRYAAVAGAVIALESDAEVLGGALDRAVAILLGTGVGVAASLLVWPESAQWRARRALNKAIADCRDLLQASVDRVTGRAGRDLEPLHRRVLGNLADAQAAVADVRLKRAWRPQLERQLHAVQRLWHAIIVIDRLVEGKDALRLPPDARLAACVQDFQRAACACLAAIEENRSEQAELATLHETFEAARQALEDAPGPQGSAAHALVFGLGEVERNLKELKSAA